MRIQHNIMAMNAYRNYTNNVSALSKNLEKLSSGYRINRAGDDAAGLAISEKMRAQITGLDAAQKNVKDGISLVQTAEGALQEVQDMLNRMVYLATQSANGTYDNEVDRANLQKEVDQLSTEIDRIADSANFNGIKLLDGSLQDKAAGIQSVQLKGMDRILSSVIGEGEKPMDVAGQKTILDTSVPTAAKASFKIDLSTVKFSSVASTGLTGSFTLSVAGNNYSVSLGSTTFTASTVAVGLGQSIGATTTLNGVEWDVVASGTTITFTQKKIPTTAEEAKANFDVQVSAATDDGGVVSGSIKPGTFVATPGIAAANAAKANTVFKITEDDIVDGATITIGTKTVTLKVGAESTIATGANVADLSFMEEGNIDINQALMEISEAFGSSVGVSNVKTPAGSAVSNVTFQVGVSDGSNGYPTGLTVQRSDTGDAAFTTIEKLADIFSMNYVKNTSSTSSLTLQIGDTADDYNQLSVAVQDMHVDALGIGDIDISTQEGAQKAVEKIKAAINSVSMTRGTLGATQNRLEHTANNLSVMEENITDAESSIRDTDVAEEMMAYTKNNILIQSAQAMLAQANMVPQGVLQLLG